MVSSLFIGAMFVPRVCMPYFGHIPGLTCTIFMTYDMMFDIAPITATDIEATN